MIPTRSAVLLATLAVLLPGRASADPLVPDNPRIKVKNRVPLKACAFDLRDVRLLEGPFLKARELDRQYLLSLDPDRLLHTFRVQAGLPSAAKPLGGWEAPTCELRGHFVGHYLSACALMYASTGDARIRERVDGMVAELARCQAAAGNGYLSAYPVELIDRVEAGKRVWAPYYTLHKIFAGLLDVAEYCDNAKALEMAGAFADWVKGRTDTLGEEAMQKMLGNEHGGMNEALANLYALTGEERHLQLALRFNHRAVIDPASRRIDALTGLHANTQIPKFIGTAREYELTGTEALRTASVFFWETVVRERSYVIGGNSDGEHFTPKESLSKALGPNTTETCNTYNMLKLTRHLFCWEPRAEAADYTERALYNHILASQNPETGMMCYYVPLRTGARKTYNGPTDGFWCCTGTGVENHAKAGESVYYHDGASALYVNLFVASELDWKARGVKIRQETAFPDEGATRLVFTCEKPVDLTLNLRHPGWAVNGIRVRVNGTDAKVESRPSGYAVLSRTWKSGDTVDMDLPMGVRIEAFRNNPRRFAYLSGPVVLAAEVKPGRPAPVLVAEPDRLASLLQPVDGRPHTYAGAADAFRIPGGGEAGAVRLEPFFRIHGARHTLVYWDAFTPDQWKAKEEEVRAAQAKDRELEARTVDLVRPGEEQNERDHDLRGERTGSGDFGERKYRDATEGGWFSYALRILPDAPQVLVVTYWGSDRGGRDFDILVDGERIATVVLNGSHPDAFFDAPIPIPAERTRGRERVTVRFQAHPGKWAGGVFGIRVLKAAGEKGDK
jgi:DUF1680 family protein